MDPFVSELLANGIGGVITAALVGGVIACRDARRKHREESKLKDLIEIMGQAIGHRNNGKARDFQSEVEWIREAKKIEKEAMSRAYEISLAAKAHIEWLDEVDPYPSGNELEKYISVLSKVSERIRELLRWSGIPQFD